MVPQMANFLGNVHGGWLLGFLDRVAYVCGSRYCGLPLVTLSVDQVFFKEPIYVGELLTCYACVNYVGKTSMEIGIRVTTENLQTGQIRHTNTCYITMVAIDKDQQPTPIPPLVLHNEDEERRFDEALKRRQMRLKLYKDKDPT
ncbi:MAG: acyl-CoA thioesterase [Gammaproteobacteria bacterium]|nr:acyl-CoA thioesterase [Gammaproteobacteria bacterium]